MIAVSLNFGGAVLLITPAKLYICTQNTTNTEVMCLIWFRTLAHLFVKTDANFVSLITELTLNIGTICQSAYEKIIIIK